MNAKSTRIHRTAIHEAAHAVVATFLGYDVIKATIEPNEWVRGFVEHRLNSPVDYEGASDLLEQASTLAFSPGIEAVAAQGIGEPWTDAEVRGALAGLQSVFENSHRTSALNHKLTEAIHEGLILTSMAGEAAVCVLDNRATANWDGGSSGDAVQIETFLERLNDLDDVARHDVDDKGVHSRVTLYDEPSYREYLWVRTTMYVRKHWKMIQAVADALERHRTLTGAQVGAIIKEIGTRRPF